MFHRQSGELVIRFVEGFIQHDGRIHRHAVVVPAQLVSQGCGQARGGQFLPLAAGLASTAAVDLDLDAAFIDFPSDELNMLSNVEAQSHASVLLGVLTGESINKSSQG